MIDGTMEILAVLMAVAVLVYWLSEVAILRGLFALLPPVFWLFSIPALLTNLGLLPASSSLYIWMTSYLLPVALFLLVVSINVPSLLRVGGSALIMLVGGAVGVVAGAVVAFFSVNGGLPDNGWQGLTLLSAAWTGSSANMLAVQGRIASEPDLLYGVLGVSVALSHVVLGLLILLGNQQMRLDGWLRADWQPLEALAADMEAQRQTQRPLATRDIMIMLAGTFSLCILLRGIAQTIPALNDPVLLTPSALTIILAVVLGLFLSRKRTRFEQLGAPNLGYAMLLLLVTVAGAQADLSAIASTPALVFGAIIVVLVQMTVLILLAYALKLPFFFVAAGSMANLGGGVTASLTATAYLPALAPLAALMGAFSFLLGMVAPLIVSAVLSGMAAG